MGRPLQVSPVSVKCCRVPCLGCSVKEFASGGTGKQSPAWLALWLLLGSETLASFWCPLSGVVPVLPLLFPVVCSPRAQLSACLTGLRGTNAKQFQPSLSFLPIMRTVGPWASHFTSSCLKLFICEMRGLNYIGGFQAVPLSILPGDLGRGEDREGEGSKGESFFFLFLLHS